MALILNFLYLRRLSREARRLSHTTNATDVVKTHKTQALWKDWNPLYTYTVVRLLIVKWIYEHNELDEGGHTGYSVSSMSLFWAATLRICTMRWHPEIMATARGSASDTSIHSSYHYKHMLARPERKDKATYGINSPRYSGYSKWKKGTTKVMRIATQDRREIWLTRESTLCFP